MFWKTKFCAFLDDLILHMGMFQMTTNSKIQETCNTPPASHKRICIGRWIIEFVLDLILNTTLTP